MPYIGILGPSRQSIVQLTTVVITNELFKCAFVCEVGTIMVCSCADPKLCNPWVGAPPLQLLQSLV